MLNRREFLQRTGVFASGLTIARFVPSKAVAWTELPQDGNGQKFAEGVVFHDRNGSGVRENGDPGVAGVAVSNGKEVTLTDKNGKWKLPVRENSCFFVIKPSGWKVPVDPHNIPQHYYVHRPEGSPKLRYKAIAPTGNLPKSIDFALQPQKEHDKFRIVMFGDPQPRNQKEVDYIAHDVVEQVARDVVAVDAKFGISLGDIMFDVLSLYGSLKGVVSTIGLPWYHVKGNHDMNYDSPQHEGSYETFISHFGPTHFAFNYGRVHFIVIDDVLYHGSAKGGYHGEITAENLEFIKNDLQYVPQDRLICLCMHIPITDVKNREELFRLFEDRPYNVSFSAHTHVAEHAFLGEKDGWKGKEPHHHINHATVCGSWWEGALDERGIPHATMSDGGPNGYSIVEFDRNKYKVMFRAASRPECEQMGIWLPEEMTSADAARTEVIVNVYAGSERSTVEMKVGSGEWTPLTRFVGKDPFFVQMKEIEAGPTPPTGLKLPNPSDTPHLWKTFMPGGLSRGVHAAEFRTTDVFGQTFIDHRVFRIV
ncbi:MAG: calcineurin-like phosphoesterase family protein [Armatimonadetes bacterium]|nr:calcineurin-like phosphoesterase family protein [Armatimonadota bacterium]